MLFSFLHIAWVLETKCQEAKRDGHGLIGTTTPSSLQKEFKTCKVDYILSNVFHVLILVSYVSYFPLPVKKTSIPYRNPNPAAHRRSWKQEEAAKAATAQTVLWELHSPSSEHLFMPFTWPDFIVISMTILENIDFLGIFQFLPLLNLISGSSENFSHYQNEVPHSLFQLVAAMFSSNEAQHIIWLVI